MASKCKRFVTDDTFKLEMLRAGTKIVVVDFYATWCRPSQRMSPVFEQLAAKYPRAMFLKVDVEKCLKASSDIMAYPTFKVYRKGTKLDELRGAHAVQLEKMIQKWCGSGEDEEEKEEPLQSVSQRQSELEDSLLSMGSTVCNDSKNLERGDGDHELGERGNGAHDAVVCRDGDSDVKKCGEEELMREGSEESEERFSSEESEAQEERRLSFGEVSLEHLGEMRRQSLGCFPSTASFHDPGARGSQSHQGGARAKSHLHSARSLGELCEDESSWRNPRVTWDFEGISDSGNENSDDWLLHGDGVEIGRRMNAGDTAAFNDHQLSELRGKLGTYESGLTKKTEEVIEWRRQAESAEDYNSDLLGQLNQLKLSPNSREKAVDNLSKQIEGEREEREELMSGVMVLEREKERVDRELERLEQLNTQLQHNEMDLRQQLDEALSEKHVAEERVKELCNKISLQQEQQKNLKKLIEQQKFSPPEFQMETSGDVSVEQEGDELSRSDVWKAVFGAVFENVEKVTQMKKCDHID